MMYGYRGGFWMMPYMFFCLIIVVLVIVLVMKFFNRPNTGITFENRKALDILNERFAAGEITEEENQRKRQLLMKK